MHSRATGATPTRTARGGRRPTRRAASSSSPRFSDRTPRSRRFPSPGCCYSPPPRWLPSRSCGRGTFASGDDLLGCALRKFRHRRLVRRNVVFGRLRVRCAPRLSPGSFISSVCCASVHNRFRRLRRTGTRQGPATALGLGESPPAGDHRVLTGRKPRPARAAGRAARAADRRTVAATRDERPPSWTTSLGRGPDVVWTARGLVAYDVLLYTTKDRLGNAALAPLIDQIVTVRFADVARADRRFAGQRIYSIVPQETAAPTLVRPECDFDFL